MSLSSFALLLGVAYYLFGFPLLFSERKAMSWKRKVAKDDVVVRLLAAAFVFMALLTLRTQYLLTPDAEGLVVLLAWAVLIKSIILAWWPAKVMAWKMGYEDALLANPTLHVGAGLLLVFLGALFTYLGIVLV